MSAFRALIARLERRSSEDEAMDWIIAGLGNPGPRYADTRHNIGKMIVERLAERHGIGLSESRNDARYGKGRVGDARVLLATPLLYMNDSGRAIGPLARFFKIPAENVLVVYDEMDLPLGRIRIREKGGAGGHNGMRSLIQHLGGEDFPRLRAGIGRPPKDWAGADYVLSSFTGEEAEERDELIERAADAIEEIIRESLISAMNRHNRGEV
jgi:PTH1 family peptidyl-tRNA hydrolase